MPAKPKPKQADVKPRTWVLELGLTCDSDATTLPIKQIFRFKVRGDHDDAIWKKALNYRELCAAVERNDLWDIIEPLQKALKRAKVPVEASAVYQSGKWYRMERK